MNQIASYVCENCGLLHGYLMRKLENFIKTKGGQMPHCTSCHRKLVPFTPGEEPEETGNAEPAEVAKA
jgi:hypothetical protein